MKQTAFPLRKLILTLIAWGPAHLCVWSQVNITRPHLEVHYRIPFEDTNGKVITYIENYVRIHPIDSLTIFEFRIPRTALTKTSVTPMGTDTTYFVWTNGLVYGLYYNNGLEGEPTTRKVENIMRQRMFYDTPLFPYILSGEMTLLKESAEYETAQSQIWSETYIFTDPLYAGDSVICEFDRRLRSPDFSLSTQLDSARGAPITKLRMVHLAEFRDGETTVQESRSTTVEVKHLSEVGYKPPAILLERYRTDRNKYAERLSQRTTPDLH